MREEVSLRASGHSTLLSFLAIKAKTGTEPITRELPDKCKVPDSKWSSSLGTRNPV